MKANEVHNVTDLMKAAAKALRNRDVETLEDLIHLVKEWCQMDYEREAQVAMLHAMMEAASELEMHEQYR